MPDLYALLMAADCYLPNMTAEGTYPNLGGCVRDVSHVEEFLKTKLGMDDGHILKLTSTHNGAAQPPEPKAQWPTYGNMVAAFRTITGRAKAGDQVYVHYSGHGGRSPTIVPKLKGKDELDESLVPIDIGQGGQYLRDIEVATLLKAMVDKGLLVTVVFDSCHSGGATRAALPAVPTGDIGIRGVSWVDYKTPVKPSLIPANELETTWEGLNAGQGEAATRALTLGSGWLPEPQGYTLLAACRPSEFAYEYAFDGKERNGALTYSLLESLQQIGPDLTYRVVYDHVLARVHSQFENQMPLLQGEMDRVVFGSGSVESQPAAIVEKIDPANSKRILIQAGQSGGIRPGAQFVIYPAGAKDLSDPKGRIALAKVAQLGAAESWAEVTQSFGSRAIQQGDQAVLTGAGSVKLVRKVKIVRADDKPPTAEDAALNAVAQAMAGNGWVERAEPGEPADFGVTLSEDGKEYRVLDRGGQFVTNLRPALKADPAEAPKLVGRLVHLAKFRATEELANNDLNSPLAGTLVVELAGYQDDYDTSDAPDPEPFPKSGGVPVLKDGQWTFLRIRNNSTQVLNVTVLDLAADWGVAQAFPRRQNVFGEPLDPGRELQLIPLQASLPAGYEKGTEILKVFGTVGGANFQVLTLPSLDQPPAARAATRGLGGSLLDQLLGTFAADQPGTRALNPGATPSEDWASAQIVVQIERPGARPSPAASASTRKKTAGPKSKAPTTKPKARAKVKTKTKAEAEAKTKTKAEAKTKVAAKTKASTKTKKAPTKVKAARKAKPSTAPGRDGVKAKAKPKTASKPKSRKAT